jgi:hypothetical protein
VLNANDKGQPISNSFECPGHSSERRCGARGEPCS